MAPVKHIFYEKEWILNGFKYRTSTAILSEVPFDPEILVLGTFNPEQPDNNPEFYYGRNYFWPLIFNLLKHKSIHYTKKRENYDSPLLSIGEILGICQKYKLVFADLISQVLHVGNPEYIWQKRKGKGRPSQNLIYKGNKFNLIQDYTKTEKSITTYGLSELAKENQIDWNAERIQKFIQENKSIKTVYLTCNPSGSFKKKWNEITKYNYGRKVNFRRLFTPSAQGTPKKCHKMKYVLQHWLGKFDFKGNYEGIDLDWLRNYLSNNDIENLKNLDCTIL